MKIRVLAATLPLLIIGAGCVPSPGSPVTTVPAPVAVLPAPAPVPAPAVVAPADAPQRDSLSWTYRDGLRDIDVPLKPGVIELPVVSYERPGLLLNKPDEQRKLREKLIEPFFAFKNDPEPNYVAMVIEVPTDVGSPYLVTAVHRNGGTEGFLFGNREKDFDYWQPPCGIAGEISFTDAFKAKYPQIVASACKP